MEKPLKTRKKGRGMNSPDEKRDDFGRQATVWELQTHEDPMYNEKIHICI